MQDEGLYGNVGTTRWCGNFCSNHTLILCTTQHSSPEAKFEILRILQTMKMSCWSGSNTLILTTGRQMVPRSFLWDSLQSWSECFLWSLVHGVECATFWDELSRLLICQNDLRFLGGKMRRSQRSLLRLGALAHICGRQGQRQGQGQVGQGCPSSLFRCALSDRCVPHMEEHHDDKSTSRATPSRRLHLLL